jgi:hypothetical protein
VPYHIVKASDGTAWAGDEGGGGVDDTSVVEKVQGLLEVGAHCDSRLLAL